MSIILLFIIILLVWTNMGWFILLQRSKRNAYLWEQEARKLLKTLKELTEALPY